MNNMVAFCSSCNADQNFILINKYKEYKFRTELFEIDVQIPHCGICSEEVSVELYDNLILKKLSDLYIEKHSIAPEQIKQIRQRYGFNQKIFSEILNWGIATVKRYETGASLPDATHMSILKMLKNSPNVLSNFYQETKNKFSEEEQRLIESKLSTFTNEVLENTSLDMLNTLYSAHRSSIDSGFSDFHPQKLFSMILFFAKPKVLKTKLMKLLWYSDFLMFKRHVSSISGTPYWHLPHGPVPKGHDLIIGCLESLHSIKIEEQENDEYVRIEISAIEEFDPSLFDEDEIKVLHDVNKYFSNFGSIKISDFSHQELGWKETNDQQIIPYNYALHLNIQ